MLIDDRLIGGRRFGRRKQCRRGCFVLISIESIARDSHDSDDCQSDENGNFSLVFVPKNLRVERRFGGGFFCDWHANYSGRVYATRPRAAQDRYFRALRNLNRSGIVVKTPTATSARPALCRSSLSKLLLRRRPIPTPSAPRVSAIIPISGNIRVTLFPVKFMPFPTPSLISHLRSVVVRKDNRSGRLENRTDRF